MPSTKQIICNHCRDLVEVVDRAVVLHDRDGLPCPGAGAWHVSVRRADGTSVEIRGGPGVEIRSATEVACPGCGGPHGLLVEARVDHGAIERASRN